MYIDKLMMDRLEIRTQIAAVLRYYYAVFDTVIVRYSTVVITVENTVKILEI